MKPKHEVADIIRQFGESFNNQYKPNPYLQKTLRALENCRTAAMGGHLDECCDCGHLRASYNSCRNRHCPKCQNTQREAWIDARKEDLLPVAYFHVVFTMPDYLNCLCIQYPAVMYGLLFKAAWETISTFGIDKSGVDMGMVAILHTWGQNLSLHPHLHCIVPGGGITVKGDWKETGSRKYNFLFSVNQLGRVFKGKYLYHLINWANQHNVEVPKRPKYVPRKEGWVVYAKTLFASVDRVIEYLGRYTHKIAISNHRLLNVDNENVRFTWKDYRDNDRKKVMQLKGEEFLRRFCLHILPKRFVRIRHYGMLSSTRRKELRDIQRLLGLNPPEKRTKKDWKQTCIDNLNYNPDACPVCKGRMITIKTLLPNFRGPPKTPVLTNVSVNV